MSVTSSTGSTTVPAVQVLMCAVKMEGTKIAMPVKKRLGPIKWLRTINALKNIRPTQKVRNMPNSSRTCMSKFFVRTFSTGTTLVRKRSPCWIWTENHTVRFDPEFRFAIEISYIEFALPFHNRYQD
jgi:hypothetical protein